MIAQVESKELGKTDGLLERFVPRCPSKRTQCGVRFWTREIPSPPLCIHQLCFQPLFYLIKFLVDDLAKRPHCKSVEREERALYLQGSSILYADGSRARPKLGPNIRPCIIGHEAHVVVDSISLTVNTPAPSQYFTFSAARLYVFARDFVAFMSQSDCAPIHYLNTPVLRALFQSRSRDCRIMILDSRSLFEDFS